MVDKFDPPKSCPPTPDDLTCKDFQLNNLIDVCFIDSVVNENLNIGGAEIRVFKLLGIHEQGQLVDLTGMGEAISGGDQTTFPVSGGFTLIGSTCPSEWRSEQTGAGVIQSAFIGYDFGEHEIDETNSRYGIDTFIRQHISRIIIQQGPLAKNRATKVRVERSDDGVTWFGVDIIDLPDDEFAHEIAFNTSAPARRWRLRPIVFNGGASDFWIVVNLQLISLHETTLENLQDDFGFIEARNRDYASQSISLKASYDLLDIQTEFNRWGAGLPTQTFYFQVHFNSAVAALGRPVIIGDIFEVPSETQFSPTLEPIKKFVEVVDVGWSTEGYAPGWQPLIQRVIAEPAIPREETQDIFGDFVPQVDETGFLNIDTSKYQDLTDVDAKIKAAANTNLPERGEDTTNVAEISQNQIDAAAVQGVNIGKLSVNSKALYIEDGLPPNGAPFTEGLALPDSPKDGDYHRLTFDNLFNVPPRLFRFSLSKGRWIFLEVDRRQEFNEQKPVLQSFLKSPTKADPEDIKNC